MVNDGGVPALDSAPDSVEITATNRAPIAQGDAYSVAMGATSPSMPRPACSPTTPMRTAMR
jgi:hypothetical protein